MAGASSTARSPRSALFRALELFRREIDRALALGGWDGVAKLDPSIFFRSPPEGADRLYQASAPNGY